MEDVSDDLAWVDSAIGAAHESFSSSSLLFAPEIETFRGAYTGAERDSDSENAPDNGRVRIEVKDPNDISSETVKQAELTSRSFRVRINEARNEVKLISPNALILQDSPHSTDSPDAREPFGITLEEEASEVRPFQFDDEALEASELRCDEDALNDNNDDAFSFQNEHLRARNDTLNVALSDMAFRHEELMRYLLASFGTMTSLLHIETGSDTDSSGIDNITEGHHTEETVENYVERILRALQETSSQAPAIPADKRVSELEEIVQKQEAANTALIAEKRQLEAQLEDVTNRAVQELSDNCERAQEDACKREQDFEEERCAYREEIGRLEASVQSLSAARRAEQEQQDDAANRQFTEQDSSLSMDSSSIASVLDDTHYTSAFRSLDNQLERRRLLYSQTSKALADFKQDIEAAETVPDQLMRVCEIIRDDICEVVGKHDEVLSFLHHTAAIASGEAVFGNSGSFLASQDVSRSSEAAAGIVDVVQNHLQQMRAVWSRELANVDGLRKKLSEAEEREDQLLAQHPRRADDLGDRMKGMVAQNESLSSELEYSKQMCADKEHRLVLEEEERVRISNSLGQTTRELDNVRAAYAQVCAELGRRKEQLRAARARGDKYKGMLESKHAKHQDEIRFLQHKVAEMEMLDAQDSAVQSSIKEMRAILSARDQAALEIAAAARKEAADKLERMAKHRQVELAQLSAHEQTILGSFVRGLERAVQVLRH